jgi:hypothetical protein
LQIIAREENVSKVCLSRLQEAKIEGLEKVFVWPRDGYDWDRVWWADGAVDRGWTNGDQGELS